MEHREQLTAEDIDELFRTASRRIFRVESLPEYNVPGDLAIFAHFTRGVPLLPFEHSGVKDWLDKIHRICERGISFQRLRLIPRLITPYLRYEIDWYYSHSKPYGEDTRFYPLTSMPQSIKSDFYVFDDAKVVHIEYNARCDWTGSYLETNDTRANELINGSSVIWNNATKLEDFLARYRSLTVELE